MGLTHEQLTARLQEIGAHRTKVKGNLETLKTATVNSQRAEIALEAQYALMTDLMEKSIKGDQPTEEAKAAPEAAT